MIKKEMSIKRCLIAASMAGTMVLSSIPAVPVFAEDEVIGNVAYSYADDSITVPGYYFYTTAAVKANKIPAANKWVYTNSKGKLSVANITKETKLYFSSTPTPSSLEEIVEVTVEAPVVLKKAKYAAATNGVEAASAADAITIEGKKGKSDATVDVVEFASGNAWVSLSTMSSDDFEDLKKFGGSLTLRAGGGSDKSFPITAGSEEATAKASVDGVRPGVSKVVKVTKRAAGPAVKINYANHVLTINKNLSYDLVASYDAVPEYSASLTEAKMETAKAGQIYAVRTAAKNAKAASLTTYVKIPENVEKPFSDTNSTAIMTDTTLQIYAGSAAKVAYQYALLSDLSAYVLPKSGNTDASFDYGKAATKTTAISWKSVSTNKTTGLASVNLKSKIKSDTKYVLVRKAAVGSSFSSAVRVFKLEDNKALDFTKDYTSESFDASGEASPSYTVSESNGTFTLTATGSADAIAIDSSKTIKAKVGRKSYTSKTPSVSGKSATFTFENLPDGNNADVTLTIPKDLITYTVNGQTFKSVAGTVTTKYTKVTEDEEEEQGDKAAPEAKATSASFANGKLTVKFDNAIAKADSYVGCVTATQAGLTIDASKASLSSDGKELEIPYDVSATQSTDKKITVTVAADKLTNSDGKIKVAKADLETDNPTYSQVTPSGFGTLPSSISDGGEENLDWEFANNDVVTISNNNLGSAASNNNSITGVTKRQSDTKLRIVITNNSSSSISDLTGLKITVSGLKDAEGNTINDIIHTY